MSEQQVNKPVPTTVTVTYAPCISGPLPGPCVVTIYTATGPRHPVLARVHERVLTEWVDRGTQYVNNWPVSPLPLGHGLQFTFDCPAPDQYWEINIQTPRFSPFPDYRDSMIGSCEDRSFTIVYPGIITRDKPLVLSESEVFANYVSKPATAGGGSATA